MKRCRRPDRRWRTSGRHPRTGKHPAARHSDRGCPTPPPARRRTAPPGTQPNHARGGLELRNLDVLPFSRALPMMQRGHDGEREVARSDEVRVSVPPARGPFRVRLRPKIPKPRERRKALPHGRKVPHRPHRAVAGAANHDQARVVLFERVIVDVETVYRPRRVVLHHHVRLRRQPPEQLLPVRRVEIDGDGALVAVVLAVGRVGAAPCRRIALAVMNAPVREPWWTQP